MNELFERVAGFPVEEFDLVQLKLYVSVDDERDTLELIAEMSALYPDPVQAEVAFIAVWDVMRKVSPKTPL